MPISGYPSATSARHGGCVGLHLSCEPAATVRATVVRVGAVDEAMWTAMADVGPQPIPADGSRTGFGWPVALAVPIGVEWPSGLYRVDLRRVSDGPDDVYSFHLVVRAASPDAAASVLLVYSDMTGHAYNVEGGDCLYEFVREDGVAVDRVSFDRPGGLDYAYEEGFARWFDGEGIATQACTSVDLHTSPELLAGYRLVVSLGHDEYWSKEMRDAVEGFIGRGGNAAFLSGNVCWWPVRFDDVRTMICYKDAATDPLAGVDDSRVTANWSAYPVCRPENTLTGVGWRSGAQTNGGPTGYVCWFPEHWVFDGTGLAEGDRFGGGYIGYETDPASSRRSTAGRGPRERTAPHRRSSSSPPPATAPQSCRATRRWVPTAGAAQCSPPQRSIGETACWPVTLCCRRSPETLSVGSPPMAPAAGGNASGRRTRSSRWPPRAAKLFAATEDGTQRQRPAVAQNLHWQQLRQASAVAMAANGYAKTQHQPLYGVDADDQLWWRDPRPWGTWAALGSANGCIAVAVNNADALLGVDAAGSVWKRQPARTAAWKPAGIAGMTVRHLAAQYRALIACDDSGQFWTRLCWSSGLDENAPWTPLGEPLDVTAIAVTEGGGMYAATAADVLWRRDLPRSAALGFRDPQH